MNNKFQRCGFQQINKEQYKIHLKSRRIDFMVPRSNVFLLFFFQFYKLK